MAVAREGLTLAVGMVLEAEQSAVSLAVSLCLAGNKEYLVLTLCLWVGS